MDMKKFAIVMVSATVLLSGIILAGQIGDGANVGAKSGVSGNAKNSIHGDFCPPCSKCEDCPPCPVCP